MLHVKIELIEGVARAQKAGLVADRVAGAPPREDANVAVLSQ